MTYMEYWVKNGNKWSVIFSMVFALLLGKKIEKIVSKLIQIDSFLLSAFIGIGTIYLVLFILGYLKKNKKLNI